ncbi:gephyrin-like molybdotransferase receptor GlpR [Saccharomonospora sp.]|uniref:divisome protein SepX/GlpR n=1 Tax=Saccharomonospora sp. TaxID=33913 RepID=UPI00261A5B4D|nr:gephyrin-like molybdotransferase receptor GlpR [Saccharomonospora sp.]
MPSSLIIVGLAAAWLAVLVPMVARKRQVITQTNDAALAARVVRSGSAHSVSNGEFERGDTDALNDGELIDADDEDMRDERGVYDEPETTHDDIYSDEHDTYSDDHRDAEDSEFDEYPSRRAPVTEERPMRRYRPGRGGFDPEAAAMAAKAKYAFRQRAVLVLLLAVVTTAIAAGFVLPVLWWVHGVADVLLAGYLVYLRRQVRIEEEIRQRRLARLRAASRRAPRRPDPLADIEVLKNEPGDVVGAERKPMPTTRVRRQAVVVDLEDEDPAFHELDDPSRYSYRRAAGE